MVMTSTNLYGSPDPVKVTQPVVEQPKVKSDGGSTTYYELPPGAKELNDLIEHKNMNFALGNIFKACYRFGEKDGAEKIYDLNKIIYFAERLKTMVEKGQA